MISFKPEQTNKRSYIADIELLNAFISSGLLWEWDTDRNVSQGIINILMSQHLLSVLTPSPCHLGPWDPWTWDQERAPGDWSRVGPRVGSYKVVNLPPWWQFGNTNIKWFVLLFVRVTDTIYPGLGLTSQLRKSFIISLSTITLQKIEFYTSTPTKIILSILCM